MFPVLFNAFNRNSIAVIKDVIQGNIFYARNIHKCRPRCTAYNLRPPPPPISGSNVSSIEKLTEYLKHPYIKNVVVLAGAGISTLCGIPDFRTPGTGLYDNMDKYGLPSSEAIFDIEYFTYDPKPFFNLAKEIYPGKIEPGVAHYFVKLLEDKGKLLRMYTQNIDALEKLAGISPSKVVECHGSFATATCMRCGAKYSGELIKEDIFADIVPKCREINCSGIIKPDVTFFGENLSEKFYTCFEDKEKMDLMIIMGTSLAVQPFSSLAYMMPKTVPRLLLNLHNVLEGSSRQNDIIENGDLRHTIPGIVQSLGWSGDLEDMKKPNSSE